MGRLCTTSKNNKIVRVSISSLSQRLMCELCNCHSLFERKGELRLNQFMSMRLLVLEQLNCTYAVLCQRSNLIKGSFEKCQQKGSCFINIKFTLVCNKNFLDYYQSTIALFRKKPKPSMLFKDNSIQSYNI